MKKTAFFSVSSLGLGHAARTAPLIRSYLDSHDVHVISFGAALAFLKEEFKGTSATFYEFADYPPIERGKGTWKFYWYLIRDSIATVFIMNREHEFVLKLARDVHPEFVISDGRYGSYIPGTPSLLLTHQVSFSMPKGFGWFQSVADKFNFGKFKNFGMILIPDYEDESASLAGTLSHHPMLSRLNHRFVGILTLSPRKNVEKDIDALFSISGYLVEHRPTFINKLVEGAKKLPGKKVFVLGNPYGDRVSMPEFGIEIYPSAAGDLRADLFSRAKWIVSRSGYTTIMDLVELETPGFLIPTPGQTEQEYLAELLGQKGYFAVGGDDADLSALAKTPPIGFKAPWKTTESVKKVREAVSGLVKAA
ncbi:MAG TPA: glycosyltransferase [Candidatus Paceibacterota bacterium]|nr:glycosyltransferase [Candidatus Paceibacterota bacterium]